ncbi:MAG: CHAT domain-containing tetratricopeptide repeat protein [Candidatus Krumholzibacteria bacterium]|nr:CHAT domain-containing tetratricopeptide repeat protein [Candidatus Krumholzibacteria bacterium]MDH4338173.1 CHAT domain-containing tetratricopeptide repeat protein [Candidatus Krumholzibacteria bacterium]MDH5269838.1 CHAT domain-containing tetratricopeptide repeat protein [Candidatus Krumholzibacteria bacterium]
MRAVLVIVILLAAPVPGYTASTVSIADSLAARVEPLFAAGAYDSILALLPGYLLEAESRGDSILLGRALTQRGRVLLMKGMRERAIVDLDAGVGIAEAMADTAGLMPALNFRGFAYGGAGAWDDAMRCYQRRLDLALLVRSPLDEAWARTSIAYVQQQRGHEDEARKNYRRAIALFRAAQRPRLELTPLIGLGRVESAAGNEREAIRCYQRAWVVAREVGDRVNEMWATNNLGSLEESSGDIGRAAEYQRRAYEIARELAYPHGIVIPAINLARRATELGDFAGADAILRETRELCVSQSEPESIDIVDFAIANLRLAEGRYQEAAAILDRLLTPVTRLEPQYRDRAMLGYARALNASAGAEPAVAWLEHRFDAGDLTHADTRAGVALYCAFLYAEAGRTERALAFAARARALADDNGLVRLAVAARLRESICERALGRPASATASLHAAMEQLEAFRGRISSPEWREAYGQETSRLVLQASRVLLEYPDSLSAAARERTFFDTMQRVKTRTLLDRISDPRATPGALAVRNPVTLSETQAALRDGELLLDFLAGDEMSFLFVVSPGDCRLLELPGIGSPLEERVDLFRRIVASPDPVGRAQYPPERIAPMQRALGHEVLGAAAGLIEAARCVFVSPDGFYSRIPFGILMPGDAPLMAGRDVILMPSASLLVLDRARGRTHCEDAGRLVAIGAGADARLPGARDEVNGLARHYRNVDRVPVIPGGEALADLLTPCDVLHVAAHALVVDRSPWDSGILLGTPVGGGDDALRASSDTQPPRPILSAADSLLVAREFPGDPYLRAWRIAGLPIHARLAVLAACETAGGRVTTGEGTLGITAAFLSAGVPVVVSSLWPVDDRSTERIMTSFYRRLARGTPVATALREAQLEMSRTPGGAHPFLWAGFTVVGDGTDPVPIEPRGDVRIPVLATLLLLLAAVVTVLRRRLPAGMR